MVCINSIVWIDGSKSPYSTENSELEIYEYRFIPYYLEPYPMQEWRGKCDIICTRTFTSFKLVS